MKKYITEHPWSIIEEGFKKERHMISESLFSIGNGYMGQRANFEETYTGPSLQGSYMAGVYYPDKTRVGWWKNGYPEYFAKVLNATNWIGLNITINDVTVDLNTANVKNFRRELNMKEGFLKRTFTAVLPNGCEINVSAVRFVSMAFKEIGALEYTIEAVNFDGNISITSYLDGDIINSDANYDEKFWSGVTEKVSQSEALITLKTKKLDFYYTTKKATFVSIDGENIDQTNEETRDKYCALSFSTKLKKAQTIKIHKYTAHVTSRDYAVTMLEDVASRKLSEAVSLRFDALKAAQKEAWQSKWRASDILIEGDVSAQQGIRFNIFQLHQTYTGEDARLNIGPKGFTGEKYGGSTYWDTEAYCLPFYLATSDQQIARNLLIYRHNHLEKAKENAKKLGFSKGALYPMVTMNGEECHNEWEITFEEIHRNGAIAYAVYNYVNYTGDQAYIREFGIEVLIEISRFWEERVHYVPRKDVYMMHGVTGPNEYDNNVNNNWYTNRMASWTLAYTLECLDELKKTNEGVFSTWLEKLQLSEDETTKWQEVIDKMYYPVDEDLGVFLQADQFLDKELMPVSALDQAHLPLNQNWSWDRILRSCFIKQADVLQGLHFLNHTYDLETIKRNFDFYFPMTVHESSLSPCVHAILACQLGYDETAYDMYLATARLDLDNYNNDTEDGCHITSMAGTWMSIVQGFGGMKVTNGNLSFAPTIPKLWGAYTFKIVFRQWRLNIYVSQEKVVITNETDGALNVTLYEKKMNIKALATAEVTRPTQL